MTTNIIIDNIIYSLQNSGGVSVVWYELIKRILKDSRINSKYIDYPNKDNIFRSKLDIPQKQILKPHFINPTIARYFDCKCSDINGPFIFHSSYYRISSNPKAINITTVHDFTYEYFAKGLSKIIHCWQKHRAIRDSDYVICISENTKKDLMKFIPEFPQDKIKVIYNGVSDDYFPLDEINDKDIPFGKQNYLLFVGARGGYKNFKFLVESLKGTKYNLVIVGPSLEEHEKELLNSNINNQWRYAGRLSNDKLNLLYNGAFAFIYPSSYEGFGIPVLEAQKAGCPVIALNASSIPEIVGDTSLLMNQLSKDELLNKLDILKDSHARKENILNGIENAKKYTWDNTYNQVINIYKEIESNLNNQDSYENLTNNSHI